MAINKIMVLGAGTMGMGIAQVFAEAGKTVLVRDIADAFIPVSYTHLDVYKRQVKK